MENWKDVVGYEGLYKVSNFGNILSLVGSYGRKRMKLLETPIDNTGYRTVSLCKDKKHKCESVHRIMAIAFLENELNLPCVNHINAVRSDNRLENLEWCSYKTNNTHLGRHLCKSKKIIGNNSSGDIIRLNSSREGDALGFNHSLILLCCKGKCKHHHNYIWRYEE